MSSPSAKQKPRTKEAAKVLSPKQTKDRKGSGLLSDDEPQMTLPPAVETPPRKTGSKSVGSPKSKREPATAKPPRAPQRSVSSSRGRASWRDGMIGSLARTVTATSASRIGLMLLIARLVAAYWLPMSDCDETYNYWEPLHFLLYKSGKQTWEYSSEFALRSYLFLWFYGWAGALFELVTLSTFSKVATYYAVRFAIATVTTLCEVFFIGGAARRFGRSTALILWAIILCNPGTAKAAVAFLPSSFAMCCYYVAGGGWLRYTAPTSLATPRTYHRHALAIIVFSVVLSSVAGWPFAALVGLPIAIHLIVTAGAWAPLILIGLFATLLTTIVVTLVDSMYYCAPVFSTWNIIHYNVFASKEGKGPELYGVEPWSFFFKNLALNYNVAFFFALTSVVSAAVGWFLKVVFPRWRIHGSRSDIRSISTALVNYKSIVLFSSPFYLWFVFWMRVPHKEERFMAPAYPFISLAAALNIYYLGRHIRRVISPTPVKGPLVVKSTVAQTPAKGPARDPLAVSADTSRAESPVTRLPLKTVVSGSELAELNVASSQHKNGKDSAPRTSKGTRVASIGVYGTLLVMLLISSSRIVGESYFYGGVERSVAAHLSWRAEGVFETFDPLTVQASVKTSTISQNQQLVCLGMDWYRFPSSFFLPRHSFSYGFLKTDAFSGALPKDFQYSEHGNNCTCVPNKQMNDLNQESPGQYVEDVSRCDFILDSAPPTDDRYVGMRSMTEMTRLGEVTLAKKYSSTDSNVQFEPLTDENAPYRLLDATRTPQWCRLGYIPFLTERCAVWSPVVLLRNSKSKAAGIAALYQDVDSA